MIVNQGINLIETIEFLNKTNQFKETINYQNCYNFVLFGYIEQIDDGHATEAGKSFFHNLTLTEGTVLFKGQFNLF